MSSPQHVLWTPRERRSSESCGRFPRLHANSPSLSARSTSIFTDTAASSFAHAASGMAQYGFVQEPIPDIRVHGAEQSALRPLALAGQGALDDARHVFPRQVRPKAADMGHQILRRFAQALDVAVLPCQAYLAQRGRITRAQARVSADPPLATRRGQPRLRAFPDQGSLELGRCALNLQGELALRRRRVDRVHQ